jgi:hypothetical protein
MRSFSIGYSFIAVYLPLAVLSALAFLLKGFLPLSPVPLLVCGVFGALAATLYCDFMTAPTGDANTQTSRTAADIRGLLIVLVLAYGFSSLMRGGIPWAQRFLPDFSTIVALVGTFYTWVSVVSLKQFFNTRRRFESYTHSYQGEQLHKALFDDLDFMQYIEQDINKIKQNYIVQFVVVGIVLSVNIAYKVSIPLGLYLFLAAILAGGICIYGFFGVMRREHHCAAEGLTLSSFDRTKHILGIGLFSVLSILVAVVLSSDRSLFSFSVIIGFLNLVFTLLRWIVGLFVMLWGLVWLLISRLFPEKAEPEPMEPGSLSAFLGPAEESGPSPFWTWFKYGLIIIAAAVFIRFMISPLLNRGGAPFGKMGFRRKLWHIAAEWFRGVSAGLFSFWAFIRKRGTGQKLRRPAPSAGEVHNAAASVLGAYSPAKKREMKLSATLFARLILWGGEVRQVAWKPTHAPGEYCSLLAAVPPLEEVPSTVTLPTTVNEGIIRCGELFEKALYSAEVLSEAERDEFKYLVEEITSFADN